MAGESSASLVLPLARILSGLASSPYPILESPPECKRRASVACVIRIQPSFSHWPSKPGRVDNLDTFFAQDWVQDGEPEVLFIKRAARQGDRWTSHMAFPGGKRDLTDADDKAAAVRETWEEVGLDLGAYSVECGNLPQRLVTTHWGKKPLMVLCPYVFLITTLNLPSFRLQPSEVAATHWVPVRRLLDPAQRTVVFEDVSSRLANQETGVQRWMLSLILGKMAFAAINLVPTESLHSSESPPGSSSTSLQDNRHLPSTRYNRFRVLMRRLYTSDLFHQFPLPAQESPLLLWGLTLGVMSDLLNLFPPHNALELWTYPTFTPLDARFTIWLFTLRYKARKRVELQAGSEPPLYGTHARSFASESESVPAPNSPSTAPSAVQPDETGLHGLGTGRGVSSNDPGRSMTSAVSGMLEGWVDRLVHACLPKIDNRARYYEILRKAVAVALVGRASMLVVLGAMVWSRWWRRRQGL